MGPKVPTGGGLGPQHGDLHVFFFAPRSIGTVMARHGPSPQWEGLRLAFVAEPHVEYGAMELAAAVLLDETYLQQVARCLGFRELLYLARGNGCCWRQAVALLPNLAPRAFAQLSITEKAEVLRFLAVIEARGERSLVVG